MTRRFLPTTATKGKGSIVEQRPSLSTLAIHGRKLHAHRGPVALPIYQTTNYRFERSEEAIRYSQGDDSVYVYSRYHNPTVRDVEEKLALMERAETAALFASGMAAISTTIHAWTNHGDEIVSTPALYGGTYRFFRDELPRHGVTPRFSSSGRPEEVAGILSPKTALVYVETPTNPTLGVVDLRLLVQNVREEEKRLGRSIPVIADNTFATILNQDPFALGADVIVESATKYLGGHSDVMAGVVLGSIAFVKKVRNSAKSYGGCADPFAAYLLFRSLKTFELRVKRQNENALALAQALEGHPRVARVLYPGLPSHPDHAVAKRQMSGFGGMVTVEVKPERTASPAQAAAAVCDQLRIAVNAMSLGGVETLVSIPVYSSHINMTESELRAHGVSAGMIRISVGVEGAADLIGDFLQALDAA